MSFHPYNGLVMLESKLLDHGALMSKLDQILFLLPMVKEWDVPPQHPGVRLRFSSSVLRDFAVLDGYGEVQELSELVVPDFRGNDTHVSSIISHFTFPLRKEKQKKYAPNFQLRLKPFWGSSVSLKSVPTTP